jgi:hypothetical protein
VPQHLAAAAAAPPRDRGLTHQGSLPGASGLRGTVFHDKP